MEGSAGGALAALKARRLATQPGQQIQQQEQKQQQQQHEQHDYAAQAQPRLQRSWQWQVILCQPCSFQCAASAESHSTLSRDACESHRTLGPLTHNANTINESFNHEPKVRPKGDSDVGIPLGKLQRGARKQHSLIWSPGGAAIAHWAVKQIGNGKLGWAH